MWDWTGDVEYTDEDRRADIRFFSVLGGVTVLVFAALCWIVLL